MASAKKCDICRKFYDLKNEKETKINGIATVYVRKDDSWQAKKIYDTCPECLDAIRNLLLERGKTDDQI